MESGTFSTTLGKTMALGRILFIFCFLGSTLTQKTEKIEKKLKYFQCTFTLTFSDTTVDRNSSSVICTPKKHSRKNVKVILETKDKEYAFNARININPTSIQDIEVIQLKRLICMGYGESFHGQDQRGYTCKNIDLWKNGKVSWAFVSNGDVFKKKGFYTDRNIGLSRWDTKQIMKAMKIIEEKTGCIKFTRTQNPNNNEPWLLVMRDSKCRNSGKCRNPGNYVCQRLYIEKKLNNKQIGNLGTPFNSTEWTNGTCFSGAYVIELGANRPTRFVISSTDLPSGNINGKTSVALILHELLHVLGFGHTQNRPDRDKYITINFNAIVADAHDQYKNCSESSYCKVCETHGEYDCESIMHYDNRIFAIDKRPTMIAKDPKTCDVTKWAIKLTDLDIAMLRNVYCDGQLASGQIMSTNFPNNYANNEDRQYPLKVEEGFKIELTFTEFDIEEQATCQWDYVEVLNSDNTPMMKKCGNSVPGAITSKSNTMTVKFHSDNCVTRKGFKATWKQVKDCTG